MHDFKAFDSSNIAPHLGEDRLLTYCIYPRLKGNKPEFCNVQSTWPELKERKLQSHQIVAKKEMAQLIGPHELKDTGNGFLKSNENVVSFDMLIIDIDHIPIDKSFNFIKNIKKLGFECVIYSSFNHRNPTPEKDGKPQPSCENEFRFRIIFPLQRSVTPEEWDSVWEGGNVLIGGKADKCCKPLHTAYFLPSCPDHTKDLTFMLHVKGKWLNPDYLKTLLPANTNAVSIKPDQRNNDEFLVNRTSEPLTDAKIQDIEAALEHVPADDYDIWLDIGMALHSTGDEDKARTIWDKWSQRSEKYNEADQEVKWNSFGADRGNTLGTLFHIAKEQGWPGRQPASNPHSKQFKVTDRGVEFIPSNDDPDTEQSSIWICSRLDITARTRDEHAENHGRLLEFTDPDGVHHDWAMPMELLAGDGMEYRRILLKMGLEIAPGLKTRGYLTLYIQSARPEAVARCVDRIGWYKGAFVLPDETIGQTSERVLLQTLHSNYEGWGVAGNLDNWQQALATLCIGNSRLAFAVSAAFAASLLHLLGDNSGGFHFRGPSSTGKTSALNLACSVWGDDNRLQQWRATANGLESIAAMHTDSLLVLDEMAQVDAREAGSVAYMLANGTGKVRANRDGMARRKQTWRLLFLSSGEISLAEHMMEAGQKARAGQEARLADIPVDAGAGFGLFEDLHEHPNGATLSNHIKAQSQRYYGVAGREFLRRITADINRIKATVEKSRKAFMNDCVPPHADGQVYRVADRFALVAAAGELATSLKITGWPEGEATQATRRCLDAWIESRGGTGAKEIDLALSQVRHFFEIHGESRFSPWYDDTKLTESQKTINRAGFRKKGEDGTEFYVFPELFKREICSGLDSRDVARLLVKRGLLMPDEKGNSTRSERLPDIGKKRCYRFTSQVLSESD